MTGWVSPARHVKQLSRVGSLAPVLADEFKAAGAISVLVAERQVTWAEAARRAQALSSDMRQKVAAADLEWTADINPFHQPNMAQIQAAAARSR
jgi:hypothetical protein